MITVTSPDRMPSLKLELRGDVEAHRAPEMYIRKTIKFSINNMVDGIDNLSETIVAFKEYNDLKIGFLF